MNFTTLTDLLLNEMRDLLDAEEQLLKALPKMKEAAFSPELRDAFGAHTEQTKNHVERLKQAFRALSTTPQGKHCRAMEGLIEEAEELLGEQEDADPVIFDAGLITAAQKVEHYEIAGYGSARTFARRLGATEVEKLLQQTLDEEAQTDRQLTEIAEGAVNIEAAEIDSEVVREAKSSAAAKK
jgi:ferritin-like metal-binding protein YciE